MSSDEETKKREIFDSMSPRRQQRILKKGYDKWNPFLAPKEPPFFRREGGGKTQEAVRLLEEFLQQKAKEQGQEGTLSSDYVQGAREISLGLAKGEERYQGMQDFCLWFASVRGESAEGE